MTIAQPTPSTPSRRAPRRSVPTAPAGEGVRLRLRDPAGAPGTLRGTWWPRSYDLAAEAPGLLTALWAAGIDVFRVGYDLRLWTNAPRRATVDGRPIKLGGFSGQGPTLALVDLSGWKRLELLVIPPQADQRVADRAFALAAADGDPRHAAKILEQAQHDPARPA